MDRNTIIGISLIIGILITFNLVMKPGKEEMEANKRRIDSIALVNEQVEIERKAELLLAEKQKDQPADQTVSVNNETPVVNTVDAAEIAELNQESYGDFAEAVVGEQKLIVIENELIKVQISNKGGRIYSVQLKEYRTHDSLPLILFNGDSTVFDLELISHNREISTNNLFFIPNTNEELLKVKEDKPQTLAMRLNAGESSYIEYVYTLLPNSYVVDFDVRFINMDKVLTQNTGSLALNWQVYMPQFEKGRINENNYTSLYYKPEIEKVGKFNGRSKKEFEEETISTKIKWVAFKHQFFASVIIADNNFLRAYVSSEKMEDDSKYLRHLSSLLQIPYTGSDDELIPMSFYFGPNSFTTLKKMDIELDELVNLGGAVVRWINTLLIIPIFNFLSRFINNYGVIILLLTLFIKLLLLPLTYKSFLSQAKMKALKPQIDAINDKIPSDKSVERQKATMALYKKVGVNPMGGCLIMALQFPILIAMFRFFPSSIELRQQGFLWVHDLSTFDSIFEWSKEIPMLSKYYGNHISLFTLLMTATSVISMKWNSQTPTTSSQMPNMKVMMYIMPFMFMFMFNSFSSGLTYYYFLTNLITIGQNLLFRQFIDEEELVRKLNAKKDKAKPPKTSKFQARLANMEKAAKQRGYKVPKKK